MFCDPTNPDPPVDDDDLAVVPQIRPTKLPLQRPDGQHGVPLDARLVERGQHLLVAGQAEGGDVVEQHPHLHPARRDVQQRLEEGLRRAVPTHHEVLDVHVAFGGADQSPPWPGSTPHSWRTARPCCSAWPASTPGAGSTPSPSPASPADPVRAAARERWPGRFGSRPPPPAAPRGASAARTDCRSTRTTSRPITGNSTISSSQAMAEARTTPLRHQPERKNGDRKDHQNDHQLGDHRHDQSRVAPLRSMGLVPFLPPIVTRPGCPR